MSENRKRNVKGVFFLLLGILFLMTGIYRKEHQTVAHKSNMICLECIGIG